MLSLLSCKAINAVFSKVIVPAIVILSVAVLISASNIYISFFISYCWSLLLLITLLTFLIGYITSLRAVELLYIFIL